MAEMADENTMSPPRHDHEDRIRRNVACVNCRNSKVRCRQSHVAGEPCQRCAKLGLSCVVDKSHKRITKRSKLEKLEQELDALRQAVTVPGGSPSTPAPAPAAAAAAARADEHPRLPRSPRARASQVASSYNEQQTQQKPPPTFAPAPVPPVTVPMTMTTRPQPSSLRPPKDTATQPRTIGGRRISGEDIDWYFDRYLEWFHPLVPVLRNRDPDACYQASPTLFWMVVMLACRRYPRDANEAADGNGDSQGRGGEASKETEGEGERDGADGPLYRVLTEYLDRDIWTVLSEPVTKLESIHALLLYCAWPMRADRLVADPSTVLAGIALNVSMLVGLHTGRGSHPEFCVGRRRNMSFTDEDAAVTWVIACILAQRSASNIGHPPPSIQLNDAPSRKALSSPEWADLLVSFDVERYLNRFHLAMAAHLTNATYVTENTVQGWEDEFEMLKAAMAPGESDLTRFALLVAKQDIQSYYFAHEPGHPGPGLRLHARRALVTARAVISTALALESSPLRLLSHAPSWVVRSIIAAASLLVSALHSTQPPPLDDLVGSAAAVDPHHQPTLLQQHHHPGPTSPPASSTAAQSTASPAPDTTAAAADALMSQCFAALYACSVRDADMPSRCAAIIQPFWSHRSHFPVVASPALSWTSRLSAGTTFWCLVRLQRDLAELHGDGGGQGQASQQQQQQQRQQQEEQQQQQQQQPFAQQKYWNRRELGSYPGDAVQTPDPVETAMPDTFGIDWAIFMDDFDWDGPDASLFTTAL